MTKELTDAEALLAYMDKRIAGLRELLAYVPQIMDARVGEPEPWPHWREDLERAIGEFETCAANLRETIVKAKA